MIIEDSIINNNKFLSKLWIEFKVQTDHRSAKIYQKNKISNNSVQVIWIVKEVIWYPP